MSANDSSPSNESNMDEASAASAPAATKKSETVTNVPKDKHSVSKRLQQELLSLMMSGEKGISAFPDGDNLFKWIGTIQGPIGTVKMISLFCLKYKKILVLRVL
jgi:hypothetical protein